MNDFAQVYGVPGQNCRTRFLKQAFLIIGIAGVFVGFDIALMLLVFLPAGLFNKNVLLVLGVSVLLVGFYFLRKYFKKAEREQDAFQKGVAGEVMVGRSLDKLPADYWVFHGVKLPGHDHDYDHVVIGPSGIFIVETKHWSTEITFKDGQLQYDRNLYPKDPIAQVRSNAMDLNKYMTPQIPGDTKLWVQGVVCFAGNELPGVPNVRIQNDFYVCNEKTLTGIIQGHPGHVPDEAVRAFLVGKLSEMAKR